MGLKKGKLKDVPKPGQVDFDARKAEKERKKKIKELMKELNKKTGD